MIPIRNRKKTLQVTVDEMRNFAFAYVEKYAPSKQQLKTYLLKTAKKNIKIGKGINETFIKDTVEKIKEDNSDQDFFSAIKLCKKKRIGPARTEQNRNLFFKKDMSLLDRKSVV